jgi:hypothetical protein
VTYKSGGSRKKRLACAQEIKCFYFFSLYRFSSLLLSHERASRFFRYAVPATVEADGGKRKSDQAAPDIKPLFPRYFIGADAGWCSVG